MMTSHLGELSVVRLSNAEVRPSITFSSSSCASMIIKMMMMTVTSAFNLYSDDNLNRDDNDYNIQETVRISACITMSCRILLFDQALFWKLF